MRNARSVIGALLVLGALAGSAPCQDEEPADQLDHRIGGIWRGMLMSSPLPEEVPNGTPARDVFLRGLWDGDRVLDTEILIWDLNERQLTRYLLDLSTHGINVLRIDPPEDWDAERILRTLEIFADFGVWALMEAPLSHRASVAMPAISAEPRSGELWGPQPLEREVLCEASLSGVRGLLLNSPPWPGEELGLLTPFALWADAVPWDQFDTDRQSLEGTPEGISVCFRIDEEGRHVLLWVDPEVEGLDDAEISFPALIPEPHLVDVFSMMTMRRRRFAIQGPRATVTLTAREMRGDCLILVTDLPTDWAAPDPQ